MNHEVMQELWACSEQYSNQRGWETTSLNNKNISRHFRSSSQTGHPGDPPRPHPHSVLSDLVDFPGAVLFIWSVHVKFIRWQLGERLRRHCCAVHSCSENVILNSCTSALRFWAVCGFYCLIFLSVLRWNGRVKRHKCGPAHEKIHNEKYV